jgi:hypothetical protein
MLVNNYLILTQTCSFNFSFQINVTLDRKAFYAVATLLVDPKSIPLDGEKLTSKNFEMYIPESSRAVLERLKEYVL